MGYIPREHGDRCAMGIETLVESGFANIDLIEEMYEKYQGDPLSVDPSWQKVFSEAEGEETGPSVRILDREAPSDLRIDRLIRAYRRWGHLKADVNPIRTHPVENPPQLELETLGFAQDELSHSFPTNGLLKEATASLEELIEVLEHIYCGMIGIEYTGIQDPELLAWLPQQIEATRFKVKLTIEQKKSILQHLNKSELFEVFLHTKYVGQKRFSLEGGETLIPMLAAILETGVKHKLDQFVIGMAHRGRLNVLSNILCKSYGQIFSEFEEGYIPVSFEGSGDVKYHKGFSSTLEVGGVSVDITLTPNPSHLEAVDPVVQGQVRAKQLLANDEQREHSIPILVHGDAAIAGQGVVYETLQLYRLEGYATGGTIHIIINNQIGFTTLPFDGRSTFYCSDIARTFNAPVFHVNAEDPEGCVFATNLAVELRQKFHCDVFIDLNCYRKYGHNETDEPAFTQPHEYSLIRAKKPIREIYRDHLIQQGILERQMAEMLEEEFKKALQEHLAGIQLPEKKDKPTTPPASTPQSDLFKPVETGVKKELLLEIAQKFCSIPEDLVVHRKLEKVISERLEMAEGKRALDWGMGEILAYGSLLWEGKHVRISGQDCCRGTFSHRHALWMDQEKEKAYYPLKHLKKEQGRFDIYNSPLSEFAVLGFEFGYSLAYPGALVIWEAQFGDFCNGAQVIIDQFIASSETKWGQKNGVVLFLPHGYEGQGPEHSSGRMERFLSLCGDSNMQVVYPTTPAQFFHLLRRQICKPMNKPLIVFTPKGLLRHPVCVSTLEELASGSFQEILDDPSPPKQTKELIFCSGRIFYDLVAEREKRKKKGMTLIRMEQLYPLHLERVEEIMGRYAGFRKCFWVQEEPSNMGAWEFIRSFLEQALPERIKLQYIGRGRSAATAAGSFALHQKQHRALIKELFDDEA